LTAIIATIQEQELWLNSYAPNQPSRSIFYPRLVHDFEGLDEWLVEAAASLPPRLRHDMQLCMRAGNYSYVVVEAVAGQVLRPGAPGHDDIYALLDDLRALSAEQCRSIIRAIVLRAVRHNDLELELPIDDILDDQERLETLVGQLLMPVDRAELVHLLQEPAEWRDLLVSSMQRFWDRVYRDEYAAQQAGRERNAYYHRSHGYSAHFPDLFSAVTGRRVPDHVQERMDEISTVRFVPSQHIGPYLSFLINDSLLTVFYNSRVTPAEGDEQTERQCPQ